jgi:hypothetical protein
MKSLLSTYGTSGLIKIPLYTEGTENVSWVKGIEVIGFAPATATLNEDVDYATLYVYNEQGTSADSEIAYVTDSTLDLTGYKRVMLNVSVTIRDNNTSGYLVVSTTKNGSYTDFTSRVAFTTVASNQIITLPITALTTGYYVRVHAVAVETAATENEFSLEILKVWLEK